MSNGRPWEWSFRDACLWWERYGEHRTFSDISMVAEISPERVRGAVNRFDQEMARSWRGVKDRPVWMRRLADAGALWSGPIYPYVEPGGF